MLENTPYFLIFPFFEILGGLLPPAPYGAAPGLERYYHESAFLPQTYQYANIADFTVNFTILKDQELFFI